jgi:hypothetical protein
MPRGLGPMPTWESLVKNDELSKPDVLLAAGSSDCWVGGSIPDSEFAVSEPAIPTHSQGQQREGDGQNLGEPAIGTLLLPRQSILREDHARRLYVQTRGDTEWISAGRQSNVSIARVGRTRAAPQPISSA